MQTYLAAIPETYNDIPVAGPDEEVKVKDAQPAQSPDQPEGQTSNVQQHPEDTGC